jgi:hypothetical protein
MTVRCRLFRQSTAARGQKTCQGATSPRFIQSLFSGSNAPNILLAYCSASLTPRIFTLPRGDSRSAKSRRSASPDIVVACLHGLTSITNETPATRPRHKRYLPSPPLKVCVTYHSASNVNKRYCFHKLCASKCLIFAILYSFNC